MMNMDQIDGEIAVIVRQQASLRQKQFDIQKARWQIFDPVKMSSSNEQWLTLCQISVELDAHKRQMIAVRRTLAAEG